jgi:hypothetical protein
VRTTVLTFEDEIFIEEFSTLGPSNPWDGPGLLFY